ncbi:HpcH/HpaI aldolase/citrate lyase family protein [Bordetella petrii]|uniref:HpcH/HpaI aldolase/citrate lyase family protein n=1 Tax=Bordetella petrii TaxID=94624 RepID=UPI001E626CD0|nr:CoA ester lyase [Bordetella petrii]MCD0505324.1 CoA ester lyase [Bordetella petrii]
MSKTFAWRSMLFVPIVNDRFITSALKQPADAIQLDLEDSIAPDQKARARERVAEVARRCADHGKDVIVRVNRPWRHLLRDIEASVCAQVSALTLPKVPNAAFVQSVAEIIDELETERGMPPGATRLIVMVEDAEGLHNMAEIAAAHPRVCGMIVGAEDLAVSLQMAVTPDTLYVPNVMAVAACRRAGIAPIGFVGSVADFANRDAFRQTVERGAALGFEGAFCIHPAQVPIANAAFAPAPAAVQRARALIAAFREEEAKGRSACTFEGRMVDAPVVKQAQRIVEKAEAFGI